MKKLLTILLITILPFMISGATYADDTAESSGEQTATKQICTGHCKITAVEIITDGSNDAKLIVYDGVDSGGKVVFEGTVVALGWFGGRMFLPPVYMNSGIYCVLSGAGAPSYIVEYQKD